MKSTARSLLGLVIIILALITGYFLIKPGSAGYDLTPEETLEAILEPGFEIYPEDIALLTEDEENEYFFVDVRTPYEFQNSHIPGAVNIPVHFFLDRENTRLFNDLLQDSAIVVLYGKDQLQANAGWLFLRQLGYGNVKVLLGGYDYYSTKLPVLYDMPDVPGYLVEEPAFDFAAIMEEMSGGNVASMNATQPEAIVPERKKKKNVAEGGC